MEKPLISATEFLRRLESVSASVRELETIARAKYLTDSHAANEAHAPERLRDRAMLHIARVGDATITELVNELDSNTTSVRRALFELFDQDRVALVMEKHEHTRRWRAYCPHRVVVTARGRASDISELGGNLQDWAAGDD